MAIGNGWTPTERRILEVLSDGEYHSRDELLACLQDEEADYQDMQLRLSRMRKVLNPKSQDIVCRFQNRQIGYQHVKLLSRKLASPYDGRT